MNTPPRSPARSVSTSPPVVCVCERESVFVCVFLFLYLPHLNDFPLLVQLENCPNQKGGAKVTCYRCGAADHSARDCTAPTPVGNRTCVCVCVCVCVYVSEIETPVFRVESGAFASG